MRAALWVGLVGLVLGGVVASPANAAEVTWKVATGFGGIITRGAWTPVFVDISNEGEAQTGRVVVPIEYRQPIARAVDYALPVDLPQHSRKRYTVYVPSTEFARVELQLSGLRDKKEAPPLQEATPADVVIVVVGGDPGLLAFLHRSQRFGWTQPTMGGGGGMGRGGGGMGRGGGMGSGRGFSGEVSGLVGHMEWRDLPDSWLGWDGVDVVVVGDALFSGASSQAIAALRTWVQLGGTLVLPGGSLAPGVAGGPFGADLPASVLGTTSVPNLAALGEWVGRPRPEGSALVASVSLRPGAKVLCGSATQPLLVTRRVGSGTVILAGFDYTAAPIKYWDGQSAFWPRLLRDRGADSLVSQVAQPQDMSYYGGPDSSLAGRAATIPEAELPSLWLIIGFLVAYLVVLVPVNYSVLNRMDRRELAWITTPLIVLVFTVGAYVVGYGMRGGTIVLNRLSLVEAEAGATTGRGIGYLGLFSPARTGYEVASDNPGAGLCDLPRAEEHARGRSTVLEGARPKVTDVYMNMWTTRSFSVDFPADLGKGVQGELEFDGTTFAGRVQNGTPYTLSRCHLIRAEAEAKGKPPDLRPGEAAPLSFTVGQATQIRFSQQSGYPYQQSAPGAAQPTLEQSALGAVAGLSEEPVLVAAIREPVAPVALVGKHPQVNDGTLLLVHLPIHLAPGRQVAVPEWLIRDRIVDEQGTVMPSEAGGYGGPYQGQTAYRIDHGAVVTEYTVPLGKGGGRALALTLGGTGGRVQPGYTWPASVNLSAYDFSRRAWVPMGAVSAPVRLPHPADFMSSEGQVRIRLAVPGTQADVPGLPLKATVQTP